MSITQASDFYLQMTNIWENLRHSLPPRKPGRSASKVPGTFACLYCLFHIYYYYHHLSESNFLRKAVHYTTDRLYCFALNILKKSSADSSNTLSSNLQELQKQNQIAEPLPAKYREIARLMALLQANFHPGIERAQQRVTETKEVQEQQNAQVQEISNSHQKVDVLKTQAILHVFMSVLLLKIAKHGRTITVLHKMLEDLSTAKTSVDNAEKRLNAKKEELAQVIKEIEELKQQILQIEREKDPAMDGLLKDLKSQLSTLSARYQLQSPQTPGISHGSLVRA